MIIFFSTLNGLVKLSALKAKVKLEMTVYERVQYISRHLVRWYSYFRPPVLASQYGFIRYLVSILSERM